MAGETEEKPSGWTTDTFAAHMLALRWTDERLDRERQEAQKRFEDERDRRLTEVAIEREKALKIKETADLAALQLARDIQIYKDEKANELREQINSERGLYATKGDLSAAVDTIRATVQPLAEYIAIDRGRGAGISAFWAVLVVVAGLAMTVIALLLTRGAA